jgi:hypothetical protein
MCLLDTLLITHKTMLFSLSDELPHGQDVYLAQQEILLSQEYISLSGLQARQQ